MPMPMHWDSILPDWRFQQSSLGRLHSTSTPQVLKLWMTMRRHVKIVKTLEMCWYFHIFPQRPEELQGISGCKWPPRQYSPIMFPGYPWVQPVRWFFLVGFWAQCGAVEVLCITFQHLRPLTSPWTSNGLKVCRLNKGSAQRFQIDFLSFQYISISGSTSWFQQQVNLTMVDETWVQIRSSQLPIFYNLFIDRRNMFQYFSGHVFSGMTSGWQVQRQRHTGGQNSEDGATAELGWSSEDHESQTLSAMKPAMAWHGQQGSQQRSAKYHRYESLVCVHQTKIN